MFLKLVGCVCISLSILGVRPQRAWGPSNVGFNPGYSNSWNSNNGFPNLNNNPFFGSINGGAGSWGSGINSGGRPKDISTSASNWGYEASSNMPGRGSNKPSNRPEKVSSGNTGNWQTDNRRSNEKKSGAIVNQQSSSQWNANSNSYPTNEDNNLPFSTWGNSNGNNGKNINAVGQGSGGQNRRPGNQNSNLNLNNYNDYSNNINNNDYYKNPNENVIPSDSDDEDNSVFSTWGSNNKKKPKPTSKPNGGSNKWETTTQKINKNSGTSKLEKNNKKPQKPSGTNDWDSGNTSPSREEKNPTNTNNENEKKTSTLDTSILDELDKNDWYFGKESNYPKPPFRSTLNIDVSELWNFDKNKNTNKNSRVTSSSGSTNYNNKNKNSRRNRQIEQFEEETGDIKCECVNVNDCDEEDMIITQEDVKYDPRPLEEFRCEKLTEVCCTKPKIRVSSRVNLGQGKGRLQCGQRRIGENPLDVLGENVAEPGEFPWSLRLVNAEMNCSASLIHHQMALTAAHCVTGAQPNELAVKAGVWNSNSEQFQNRQVTKIIPHPDYNSQHPRNDIALLVLETPFELTDNVNTICLPVTNDKWDPNQCVVAGWRPEEIQGQVLEVLEKEIVNFLPQAECQNIMLVTDLWRNYILHDSFVCGVEATGRKSSMGEEGGFVACPSKKQLDTFIQIGIVSKGMNFDEFGRPGIFTNVLKFLDWINENYFELGLYDDIDIRHYNSVHSGGEKSGKPVQLEIRHKNGVSYSETAKHSFI